MSSDARFLITGAGGLLGPYLMDEVRKAGHAFGSALTSTELPCDLTDRNATRKLIAIVAPGFVIHSAAFTDVDGCERDPARADLLNHQSVVNLVEALPPKVRLLVISTDQVYPDTAGPHREGSEAPVNVYGRTKLAGEQAALTRPNSLALRTNFFGRSRTAGRESLSDFVVASLLEGKPITLFDDVLFSPLHVQTVAEFAVAAISTGSGTLSGAFNLGSRDGKSKAEFGIAVARLHGLRLDTVRIGASSALPNRAKRARDLRMDTRRFEEAFGRPMPTLDSEIQRLSHPGR